MLKRNSMPLFAEQENMLRLVPMISIKSKAHSNTWLKILNNLNSFH